MSGNVATFVVPSVVKFEDVDYLQQRLAQLSEKSGLLPRLLLLPRCLKTRWLNPLGGRV